MPKYSVLVTIDTTMSAQVVVEANSPEEAEDMAIALDSDQYVWEHDDGVASRPYLGDPGNCAEELEGER